jgi:hypothetical protein
MSCGDLGISFGKGLKEKSGRQGEETTSKEHRRSRGPGTINHKP